MYAVIENGGKQYRVELGAELELDQLTADPGAKIDVGRVLLVADGDDTLIGRPVVDGARVTGEVLRPTRGDKIIVFKYRPKARRRVKHGHRQDLTVVRIADIEWAGRSAAKEAQAEAEKAAAARAEAAKEAEAKAKADAALSKKLTADKDAKADAKAATAKSTAKPKTETKAAAAKATSKSTTAKAPAKPTSTSNTTASRKTSGTANKARTTKKDQ